jgi:hypothetical protein
MSDNTRSKSPIKSVSRQQLEPKDDDDSMLSASEGSDSEVKCLWAVPD